MFRETLVKAVKQTLLDNFIRNQNWLTTLEIATISGVGEATVKAMLDIDMLNDFADSRVLRVTLKNGSLKHYPVYQVSKSALAAELSRVYGNK